MGNSGPIDVKAAVATAMKYLQEFGDLIPVRGIRLEETEYEDSGSWLITLSIADMSASPLGSLGVLVPEKRIYKIFRIDAQTGDVKSMKVRTLHPVE